MKKGISAAAAAIAALLAANTPAGARDVRVACDVTDNLDASVSARYIHTSRRATFDVSFKAPPARGLAVREALEVRIDGKRVGTLVLEPRANGSVGASLTFDSYANYGYTDRDVAPFPADWPGSLPPSTLGLTPGTRVKVGPLTCTLGS